MSTVAQPPAPILNFNAQPMLIRRAAVLGAGTMGSRIAALFDPTYISRITPGNFEDDLPKLRDCDWVIEVVAENLPIKHALLNRVAPHLTPNAILTTNTSGLPIHQIATTLPEAIKKRFFGTHFFNPPRYMQLLELIPLPETDPALLSAF